MQLKHFALLVLLMCLSLSSGAQTDINNIDLRSDNGTCSIKIEFSGITDISKIKVQLGTETGLTDLIDYEFLFDVITGLPAGYSYSRNNNIVTLSIATNNTLNTVFGNVNFMQSSGSWSQPIQIISN